MSEELPSELMTAMKALVDEFGAGRVRKAATQLGKQKAGPKPIDDYRLVKPLLKQEGMDWLMGADLRARGRQARIATTVVSLGSNYSVESAQARVQRKLRRIRIPGAIALALPEAIKTLPLSQLIQKLIEAKRLHPAVEPLVRQVVDMIEDAMVRHRALIGEPAPELSLAHIREAAAAAVGSGFQSAFKLAKVDEYRSIPGEPNEWDGIIEN